MRWLVLALLAVPAQADTLIATRTIRAQSILLADDVSLRPGTVAGTFGDAAAVIGQEARVTLYAGRPIRPGDIGPAAVIERNQLIAIVYAAGGLSIKAEGRALARGGVGDTIRVMNLASRSTILGRVQPDATVLVTAAN